MHDGIGHMLPPLDREPPRMENPPPQDGEPLPQDRETTPTPLDGKLPWDGDPPTSVNVWVVRILLECILVAVLYRVGVNTAIVLL